jgi:hypothetical protein
MMPDLLAPVTARWDRLVAAAMPRRWYPALLTLLVAAGFLPLLLPGIPAGHDLYFHLTRLVGVAEGLRGGFFPVWINFNALEGIGYGTGLFYSDLYLYPAALLVAAGVPAIFAYKLLLIVWALLTAYSMYFAALRIGKAPFGAFAAALLYVWSSYFATDVFNRAALGEVFAFLFLPWIMLGFHEVFYGDPRRFLPLALGFAGLFYAHTITFILTGIIAAVWAALLLPRLLREPERVLLIAAAAVLAAVLAAAGAVPMLEQLAHLKFNLTGQTMQSPVAERMVPLTRLVLELPYMKLEHWIPPGIGMIFVVVVCQRLRFRSAGTATDRFRDGALLTGVFSLLAATSFLPWEGMFRALSPIQFPWRFYLPATAFLALGGGLALAALTGGDSAKQRRWVYILLVGCGFAWSFNVAYVYAAKITEKALLRQFGVAESAVQAASGLHYLPQGVKIAAVTARGHDARFGGEAATARGRLSRPRYGELLLEFSGAAAATEVELPLTPYFGYRAERMAADGGRGAKLPVRLDGNFIRVVLPTGTDSGKIRVFYANTPLQNGSLLLSAAALAGTIFFVVRRKKAGRTGKK